MSEPEGGGGGKHLRAPTIEERALTVLHRHRIQHGIRDMKLHCSCGWATDRGKGAGTRHWQHVVDELMLDGLLADTVGEMDRERLIGVAKSAALLAPVKNRGEANAAFHIVTQTGIVEAVVDAVMEELGFR